MMVNKPFGDQYRFHESNRIESVISQLPDALWGDIESRYSELHGESKLLFADCCGQLKLATSLEVNPSFSSAIIGDSPPLLLCGR